MNRKTLIIILAVVGGLCLCAVVAGVVLFAQAGRMVNQAVSSDPAKAAEAARAITDYELPPGYSDSFSLDLFGVKMVGFTGKDADSFIMLFQFPPNAGLSQDQMEQQMRQMYQNQTGQNLNMEKVGTQKVTIRGQATELSIFEGTGENGVRIRQLLGVFEGKGGMAFLMVTGRVNTWDQAAVDSFIRSMR